jgi:hypothetical protein
MKMKTTGVLLILLLTGLSGYTAFGETPNAIGTIKGKLLDAETKAPLIGANVSIMNTMMGAATDLEGNFVIPNVPVGSYALKFSYMGYETMVKTDVIVKSQRITFVNAEMKMAAVEMTGVTVTAGYFAKTDEQPVSTVNFSYEEIRRAPGSAGDVSRIMMSLPSVAKVNDQSNNLIVRGGSPVENTFFIDNIEIPNINHFPTQASSGGPIGMINVDFIQEVNFYTGGFSALHGDKLSSVMDISFREGNRNEFDGQLDLNFAGFGGVAEGPLFNKKGAWLFSARRSYLDFLVKTFDAGTTVAPVYGDLQGKIVYDLNPSHKLTLLSVWGDDHNSPDRETGENNDMIYYGNQDIYEGTTGVNWRAVWGKLGFSNTSIAYTSSKFREDFFETNTGIHAVKNRSHEQTIKFRNVNHLRLNHRHTVEFGVDAKYLMADYDNFYAETTDALGDTVSALALKDGMAANKIGAFVSYVAKPFDRFTTTLGVRTDYFSYNKNVSVSPRLAFSYQITPLTSINGSAGLFYQNLPLLLLSQSGKNKALKDPMAIHYVLGIDHLLAESTKLTLEIYQKNYDRFPLNPAQPALFPIDGSFFSHYGVLIDNGKARARGIEIMLQKKLAEDFYGLASASYFRTRYKGGDGVWRDRDFDNRFTFSVEGGYKPNANWEFSLRWIYAGGAPYTPLDLEASKANHRAVLDESRINEARYSAYHSMNIRFDRRFHFSQSNLIFYLSAWNAYNRKNLATYFWNDKEQKQDTIYQWQLLPIFGLEYEL